MDKPLLQERLSEDEMESAQHYLEYGFDSTFAKVYGARLISEVKRLQAIEDRYKKIIEFMSSGGRPAMARVKAKHTLKGDVNHE